jgi:hypothetical protein
LPNPFEDDLAPRNWDRLDALGDHHGTTDESGTQLIVESAQALSFVGHDSSR